MIEKLALSLVNSERRLCPYFQSHHIKVKTNHPIRWVLWKLELTRRMVVWSMELSKFGLKFELREPIKVQCLADFVADHPPKPSSSDASNWWMLYVHGTCNPKGSGAWITLEEPGDISLKQSLRFDFKTSNNQAKYEALIVGLKLAKEVGVRKIKCKSDSKLVTG